MSVFTQLVYLKREYDIYYFCSKQKLLEHLIEKKMTEFKKVIIEILFSFL